jgi:uncharacterized protein DUF6285
MQDRPTAPELLDAMAADLYSEVREWVPRERRFRVLVLANLCAIIARELRAGEEPAREDLELFTALSGSETDDAREAAATLAAAIRRGDLDERLPEVMAGLREHVARKLDVARPGYAVSAADG